MYDLLAAEPPTTSGAGKRSRAARPGVVGAAQLLDAAGQARLLSDRGVTNATATALLGRRRVPRGLSAEALADLCFRVRAAPRRPGAAPPRTFAELLVALGGPQTTEVDAGQYDTIGGNACLWLCCVIAYTELLGRRGRRPAQYMRLLNHPSPNGALVVPRRPNSPPLSATGVGALG